MSTHLDMNLYPEANAPDNIVREIKGLISSGMLKPGQKINQREIAQKLGITTTPLREAMGKLERDGALKRINGVGIFVRRYSKEEARDFYLIREVLEGLAARLCAQRASEEQIHRLRAAAHAISQASAQGDFDKQREAEVAFHELVVAFSASALLQEELTRTFFIRTTILQFALPDEGDLAPERDHEAIVTAIRSRDPDVAERVMRRHIAAGLQDITSSDL